MTDHVLPPDREDRLRRLREIKSVEIPKLEEEYEEIRDEMVAELGDDFAYLIGPDGVKYRASITRQETLVFDLPTLERNLDDETLEEITERKVIRGKFEQAVAAGRIPSSVLVKAVSSKPKAPFVHYEKADRPAKAE